MSEKLKTYLTEGKKKLKPQLHKLDDKIERFIETIEKEWKGEKYEEGDE